MTKNKQTSLIPLEHIAQSILILRGQRVLLDGELAVLYGVTTKRFNEQVKRNLARLRHRIRVPFQVDGPDASFS